MSICIKEKNKSETNSIVPARPFRALRDNEPACPCGGDAALGIWVVIERVARARHARRIWRAHTVFADALIRR